jgi:phosphohistidine swiveling domain-containing protein
MMGMVSGMENVENVENDLDETTALRRRRRRRGSEKILMSKISDVKRFMSNEMNSNDFERALQFTSYQRQSWRKFKCPYWAGGREVIPMMVDVETLTGEEERAMAGAMYQGFACSPGRDGGNVEGVVRVIENLSEQASEIIAGEILVAYYTSPAWTPLFSLVRGIILEEGGMLSHGAVVARECGIPALSQIKGATRLLRSGDRVRMNGENGVLEIMSLFGEETKEEAGEKTGEEAGEEAGGTTCT